MSLLLLFSGSEVIERTPRDVKVGLLQQPNYAFEVWNKSGTLLADLTGLATNRNIKAGRNEAEEITFDIDADALKAYADSIGTTPQSLLSVGANEIRVRRGTNYLVGGRIDYYSTTLEDTRTISVKAVGFLSMLADRFLEKQRIFTATDAATILWTVINEMQTASANFWDTSVPVTAAYADLGITQGTLDTIGNKDRTYDTGKNVKDILVQMTELSTTSTDFEFTPEKVFNVYDRLGSDKPLIVFSYPHNILSGTVPVDGMGIYNRVVTFGSGLGDEARVQSIDQDTSSQINYDIRQRFLQFNSIQEEDTLSEHGEAELQVSKDPLEIPQIEVDLNDDITIDDFWVGDRVTVEIDDDAIPSTVSGLYRIERLDLTIGNEGQETAKLDVVK